MADKHNEQKQEQERKEREHREHQAAREARAQEQPLGGQQHQTQGQVAGSPQVPTANNQELRPAPETDMVARFERGGQPVEGAPAPVPTPGVSAPGQATPVAGMDPNMNPAVIVPPANPVPPEGGVPVPPPGGTSEPYDPNNPAHSRQGQGDPNNPYDPNNPPLTNPSLPPDPRNPNDPRNKPQPR